MSWAIKTTVSSTDEPISLAEAKAHLRLGTATNEDNYVESLIGPAARWVEGKTNRALMRQTFRLTLDAFPTGNVIELPRSPLIAGSTHVSLDYRPSTGASTDPAVVWPSSNFIVDDQSEPGRLVKKRGVSWPTGSLEAANGVGITFQAGYGHTTDIPADLLAAVRLRVGKAFFHREGGGDELDRSALDLCAAHVVPFVPKGD